jgi:hypothetical protein
MPAGRNAQLSGGAALGRVGVMVSLARWSAGSSGAVWAVGRHQLLA